MKNSYLRYYYSIFTFVALLLLYSYYYLDIVILKHFASDLSNPIFPYVQIFSHLGKSTPYIIGGLIFYFVFRVSRPTVAKASLYIFATTATSGILANLIKMLCGRARPKLYLEENIYGFFGLHTDVMHHSFPSGHATTAVGVWLAFALLFPKYRVFLFLIGVAAALSRVVLMEHYLSDVIGGAFLGGLTTVILYHLFYPQGKTINGA